MGQPLTAIPVADDLSSHLSRIAAELVELAQDSRGGRAAVMLDSMGRAIGGAVVRDIGNRLGGRLRGGSGTIRIAQDARNRRRLYEADRTAPQSSTNSGSS